MDYRLDFTERALSDLSEIVGAIALDDEDAASRFGSAMLDHVELLRRFPRMGPAIHARSQVRKLAHSPINIYYKVREEKGVVDILHFRHGSRRSPKF